MDDRISCTKEKPWDGTPARVCHEDAYEVGDQQDGWPGGDIITMRCRNCGHEWKEELPQ